MRMKKLSLAIVVVMIGMNGMLAAQPIEEVADDTGSVESHEVSHVSTVPGAMPGQAAAVGKLKVTTETARVEVIPPLPPVRSGTEEDLRQLMRKRLSELRQELGRIEEAHSRLRREYLNRANALEGTAQRRTAKTVELTRLMNELQSQEVGYLTEKAILKEQIAYTKAHPALRTASPPAAPAKPANPAVVQDPKKFFSKLRDVLENGD